MFCSALTRKYFQTMRNQNDGRFLSNSQSDFHSTPQNPFQRRRLFLITCHTKSYISNVNRAPFILLYINIICRTTTIDILLAVGGYKLKRKIIIMFPDTNSSN